MKLNKFVWFHVSTCEIMFYVLCIGLGDTEKKGTMIHCENIYLDNRCYHDITCKSQKNYINFTMASITVFIL